MTYNPCFHLKRKNSLTWLYDRDRPVLCFDADQALFGHGRLEPGGMEMFPRPGMHWSGGGMLKPFWANTMKVKRELRLFKAACGRRKASFRVVTRARECVLESDWRMDVTYDAGFRSYVYDVATAGTVVKRPDPANYNPHEFEYFDLYTNGMLVNNTALQFFRDGKHVPLPGPLWDWLVYDKDIDVYQCNRYWVKAPLNHLITSAQNNVRVRRDGFVGMMHNPAGNPMVQLVGDTAAVSRIDTCNWFYDLHFNHDLSFVQAPPPRGFSVSVRFRIVNFNVERSRLILEQAQVPILPKAEREAKTYPRYITRRVNRFERPISLTRGDHSKIWRPFHDHPLYGNFGLTDVRLHGDGVRHALFEKAFTNPGARCVWDRHSGRAGSSALCAATTSPAVAGWSLPLFEAPQVAPGRRYRLSVWIKTRALRGPGATMACLLDPYRHPWVLVEPNKQYERIPLFAPRRIRGTSDWQRVELVTPVLERTRYGGCFEYDLCICAIQPVLWHEGRGVSWFDDFILEPVPENGKSSP